MIALLELLLGLLLETFLCTADLFLQYLWDDGGPPGTEGRRMGVALGLVASVPAGLLLFGGWLTASGSPGDPAPSLLIRFPAALLWLLLGAAAGGAVGWIWDRRVDRR